MRISQALVDMPAGPSWRSGCVDGPVALARCYHVMTVASLLVVMPIFAQQVVDRPNTEIVEATGESNPSSPLADAQVRERPQEVSAERQRHVLIVMGLAGDEEHRERFRSTIGVWRDWLVKRAGVKEDHITILAGREESGGIRPATAEVIRGAAADLADRAGEQDSVWVFLVGHGSQDQRDGWFHLSGADLNAASWADLFVPLEAAEQVFWLTHSASGSFLKPMSRPGRVVITATDPDGEVNETRFPHALAEVMQRDFADSPDESSAAPRETTLLGLFQAAARDVRESFEADQLVPTEHAQLDDNGDGEGTEADELAEITTVPSLEPDTDEDSIASPEQAGGGEAIDATRAPVDGLRAGRTTIDMTTWISRGQRNSELASRVPRRLPSVGTRLARAATQAGHLVATHLSLASQLHRSGVAQRRQPYAGDGNPRCRLGGLPWAAIGTGCSRTRQRASVRAGL
jgi:hypothetical protein